MRRWQTVPMRNFLSLRAQDVDVEPSLMLTPAGIFSFGRGIFLRPPIDGLETKYSKLTALREGDFVYSKLKAWEGAFGIADVSHAGAVVSSEFPVFEVDGDSVDRGYLSYLIRSDPLVDAVKRVASGLGARRDRVHPDSILKIIVPLPSLPEQRRIAAWLSSMDNRLAANSMLKKRAARLDYAARESLLSVTAVGEPRIRLGDALESIRSEIVIDLERDYRTIGIKSFGNGLIRYPSTKGADLSKLRFYRFPVDSLAVSNIQAWEGALAMTTSEDSERVASRRFFFYVRRANGQLDPEFALAFLRTERGFGLVKAASPGTTMRNKTLSVRSFEDILIPDPGPDVQRRTVQALRTLDRLERKRNEQIVKEKSLLPAALNQVFGSLN